ncbi:MAG TPA: oligopeptidase B [Blastocatellia bacterium]|nr:oligopeptidase B [Blastocatellia bacterium]HCX29922.1 oligopeptidase B [Blastocatellia bacterium]
MKKLWNPPTANLSLVLLMILTLNGASLAQSNGDAPKPQPPMTEKKTKTTKIHNDTLVDDYFWLREKSNPEVTAHLEAENSYAEALMKPTAALQEKLYKEMVGHIKETDRSVPYQWGNYFYYTRTEQGKQYPIYARKKGSVDALEEIVLDQNELAKGFKFFNISAFVPSDDGNLLAYSTDTTGYRQYKLQVKDLRTGQLLPETFERVGQVAWANDNKTIFFTTEDAVTKRSDKFFRHVLGNEKTDLIFDEKDELFDVVAGRSRDKVIIFVGSESKTATEYRYLPAATPTAELKMISPREPDHEYDVDHRGDRFYIRTNKGAKNFRVVTAPVSDPAQQNWKELIAHRPEVKIEDINLFADHLVLSEWEKGLQQIEIHDFKTSKNHHIAFPEPVYSAALAQNREFASPVVRYNYQSLVTPSSVFDYDMNTGKATLLKETEVPGGFDKSNYKSERLFATASDGTKIPLSVVYRKGTKLDGSAPLLLYGYGSYGISIAPTFNSNRLSLVDRGVIYVIAHIRGGGELGEEWRQEGRMMKKMNTFNDFIASAEYLVKNKYTSSDRLVIQGGSAGGLLVGAVTNMRPDLFKAVVAQVPFVDVLNTMLDASLPLTTSEYIEWGNPNEKAAYDYIKQYSPYDNVGRKNYPSMLVKVSLNDSQVPYWEGSKLVARLRAMKTDNNPILLKVNMGAGHGGSSGRYDFLREVAFDYAYMLWQMGITE